MKTFFFPLVAVEGGKNLLLCPVACSVCCTQTGGVSSIIAPSLLFLEIPKMFGI
jgi:hypothetical protein